MSIQDIIIKIKRGIGEENLLKIRLFSVLGTMALIIFCALVISYKMGQLHRVTKDTAEATPIAIEYPPYVHEIKEKANNPKVANPSTKPSSGSTTKSTGAFVTSKTGKVYYPKDCNAVNRIKPENRVYFNSSAELIAKGYTLAKNCK